MMKGPTCLLILLGCTLLPGFLGSQQIYQSTDFGGPGTQYLYNRLYGFSQDSLLLKSGPDVTWDLSAYGQLQTHSSRIVTPSQAFDFTTFILICGLSGISTFDCSSIWAATQQTWLLKDTLTLFQFELADLQRYQRKTNDRLLENFFGFKVDLGGLATSAVIVYQHPDTILHFPVMYGDQFTSHTNWALDLTPTGQNVQYQSNQNRETHIDSWGTLVTPFQTFHQVIRMRSLVHRQDSITTDSFAGPLSLTQVEYMWLDTNYALPVLTAKGIVTDSAEILTSVEYLYDKTCDEPTWTVSTDGNVFYLDSTGSVTITFTIQDGNADEYLWDWGNGKFEYTTGSVSHTFTAADGYSVGVTGCMYNCLPEGSCAFAIVDFEILDTLSSVSYLPAEKAGIRLQPNPASDVVRVFLPDHLGDVPYTTIDLHGRVLGRGNLTRGFNTIDCQAWPSGLCLLQIGPGTKSTGNAYYLKLAVSHP